MVYKRNDMKRLFKIAILMLCLAAMPCGECFAQKSKDVIVMPEFPGGHEALQDYLRAEIRFPYQASVNGEIGEVLVGFSIGIDGTVSGVRVLRSVSELLDAEAIRVVKEMPKWKPGTRNGKAVRAELSIPINFAIVKNSIEGDNIDTDAKSLKKLRERQKKAMDKKKKKEEKERRKLEKKLEKERKKREKNK